MKISALYERVGNHDRAKAARAKPATDIDVFALFNKRLAASRAEVDEAIRSKA